MYSTELKLEIVRKYLQGSVCVEQLADKYHIGSKADIQKWVAAYRENGISGLCTTHETYTGDFKIFAVEYMHNRGAYASGKNKE